MMLATALPLAACLCAVVFKWRQDKSSIGGKISWPKSFWLCYCISAWFIAPIIYLLELHYSQPFPPIRPLTCILIVHLISWWCRAPIELYMMYGRKNWSPKIGIAHDLGHLVLLVSGITWMLTGTIPKQPTMHIWSAPTTRAFAFVAALVIGTIAETYFAIQFYRIRGPAAHTLYFASDATQWRTVNKVTAVVCMLLYIHFFWHCIEIL